VIGRNAAIPQHQFEIAAAYSSRVQIQVTASARLVGPKRKAEFTSI
jgi:hypothetical protein